MKNRGPNDVQSLMRHVAGKLGAPPASAKRPVKAAVPDKKVVPLPTLVHSRPAMKISDTAQAMSRRKPRRGGGDDRVPINPFVLANHPPSVFPNGKAQKMTLAQDSAICAALDWSTSQSLAVANIFGAMFDQGLGFLGYTYLAELAQRAEYRVISETLGTESTRKWIKLQATTQADGEDKAPKLKELEAELTRLRVQDVMRTASIQDGFFGRSHVYIDIGESTDNREELLTGIGDGSNLRSRAKIQKGSLNRIANVEPIWCYPSVYNSTDPLKPDWYNPSRWFVQGKEVHSTRLLTFVGREVPDLLKPAYSFGGLSMSQMAKPTVDNWLRTRQSVSDLLHSFATMVLKTDMSSILQGGAGEALFARLDMYNNLRDNRGVMTINKETEDFSNVTTPLSTLDALQAQSQEQMCSISRTPVVKLLGIQPAGLNASSEGEINTWDDWVAAYQEMFYREKLTRIIGFAQLNLWGEVDPDITFVFEPLRQMTEKERSEIDKGEAEADQIRITAGVLHPEEARARLAAAEDSPYASIDVDDVPEPPQEGGEGGEGGEPPGGGLPPGGGAPDGGEVAEDGVIPFVVRGDSEFKEADHPRASNGKFGSGGGSTPSKALKLTPTEKSYLSSYSGDDFLRLNNTIRAGNDGGPAAKKLDSAIAKASVPPGTKLYRGISRDALKKLVGGDEIHVGQVLDDKGYLSTTTDHGIAGMNSVGGVMLHIEVGEGQHGLDMSAITSNPHEKEVLLPRGTRLKVLGMRAPKQVGQPIIVRVGTEKAPAMDADWNEGNHPRGQPGNAGQFGSGSGGGKKQTVHAPQFGLLHGTFTAKGGSSSSKESAAPAPKKGNLGAPLDVSKLKKVGKQMGSNPGGVFEDDAGKKFYVKKGQTKDHVTNEMTAAALYDLAGSPTLRYRPVDGGTHIATEMSKLDKDNASKLSPAEKAEAQREFAVHAWLGNWDAVGLGGDNLGTVGGVPTALDLGGALEYRAQGSPKGKAFGEKVGEINSLRDGTNKDASGMFGKMTPADLRDSARSVTSIPDSAIKATVLKAGGTEALANKLIARKNDIAEQMKTFGAEGDPKKPTSTVVIPAGGEVPIKTLNGVKFGTYEPPADWASVDGQMADLAEPEFDAKGKALASGVVIRESDGRVWMVQPTGGFGGYEGTFPKGRVDEGLSMQANAIKEAFEESGLKVRITGHAGDHEGDMTMTRYYYAEREGGDPSKHDDETEGVVLAPKDKAAGFLNRKRDRAVLAGDEAPFDESKHPRAPDGKFGTGSGTSKTENTEPDDEDAGPMIEGKAKKTAFGGLWKVGTGAAGSKEEFGANVTHVLNKQTNAGSTYRTMLGFMIKNAPKHGLEYTVGALKAKLAEAYHLAAEKAYKIALDPKTSPADVKKFSDIGEKASVQAKANGWKSAAPAPAPEKPKAETVHAIAEQAMKDNPGMAAAMKAKPTAQELEKAKKSIALQPQYVPGYGDLQFTPTKSQADGLVKEFNDKWAGKDGLKPEQLEQKVGDFKVMTAKVATLKAAEAVNAQQLKAKEQEAQAEAKKKQADAAKKQADALKAKQAAEKDKLKEQHAEVTKELGITDPEELEAFDAFVDHFGGTASALEKFKSWQNQVQSIAKNHPGHGFDNLSGFEMGCIKAYTGPQSGWINKAIRDDVMTPAQFMFEKVLNKALGKLPIQKKPTKRGLTLDPGTQAKLQPGKIWTHRNFASSSSTGWGGNTKLHIEGKSGRYVDPISSHKGEDETLFPSNLKLLVDKVETKDGIMHVHCREV